MKTHLLHSDIVLGRQNYVPAFFTLRKWNPRPACGTAVKSGRISISGLASCQPGMSPQSASRGPVERGFVQRIPCLDTEQLAASVDGSCLKNWDVCLIFGIPSWLMPLRDRSGQSSQPFLQGTR